MAAPKKETSKTDMKSVEFTKPWKRYCAGDIAGFDEQTADKLINGLKVAVEPGKAPKTEDE